MRLQDGLVAVPVHMPGLGMLCVRALEAAYQESVRDGRAASSLLLTNPNNPLGTVYRKEDYVVSCVDRAPQRGSGLQGLRF